MALLLLLIIRRRVIVVEGRLTRRNSAQGIKFFRPATATVIIHERIWLWIIMMMIGHIRRVVRSSSVVAMCIDIVHPSRHVLVSIFIGCSCTATTAHGNWFNGSRNIRTICIVIYCWGWNDSLLLHHPDGSLHDVVSRGRAGIIIVIIP